MTTKAELREEIKELDKRCTEKSSTITELRRRSIAKDAEIDILKKTNETYLRIINELVLNNDFDTNYIIYRNRVYKVVDTRTHWCDDTVEGIIMDGVLVDIMEDRHDS